MTKHKKPLSSMTTVELHRLAMEAFDEASAIAQGPSGHEKAVNEYRIAFGYEAEAARQLAPQLENEPTRSVIHRSAATMAFRCGEFREAERIINIALSGEPHEEIASELRDLYEEVKFARSLTNRGLPLTAKDYEISLAGNAVGLGVAESEEVIRRVRTTEKIVLRLYELSLNEPFRKSGRPRNEIIDQCKIYLAPPKAGSFRMTVRVGKPETQQYLAGMEDMAVPSIEQAVTKFVECFQAFEDDPSRLEELIPDPAYRKNFLDLARQVAPDGDRIRSVGLSTGSGEQFRSVSVRRTKAEATPTGEADGAEIIEAVGTLVYANSTTSNDIIKVIEGDGSVVSFHVPEGMMADIVRPLWETRVRITGSRRGRRKVQLLTIDPI